jgi:hypothetical protein
LKSFLSVLLVVCAVRQASAADFTVTNTNSSGPGSLYQAITDANNTPGADRILFNIPGSGIHKIDVSQNPLPTIVESLTIDGYSQPGSKANSLSVGDNAVILIQIDGGSGGATPAKNGFMFNPNSGKASNHIVDGLSLTGFFGSTNGSTYGIAITAGVVDSLVVTGNFIGILPDGETARGNWTGVGHVTQLGGTDPASRNIISGNTVGFTGELATGAGPAAAIVQGNYMGTNAGGTKAVPNTDAAISLDSGATMHCETAQFDLSNTIIGGGAFGTVAGRNVISGNSAAITLGGVCSSPGVPTARTGVNGVQIQNNWIGGQSVDDILGTSRALPNGSSITIVAGSNNVITSNVIQFNGSGVIVASGTGNQILGNWIYLNQGLGIDLGGDGVTANDTNDVDSGPNNSQNFPLITSASISQADRQGFDWRMATSGTLQSTPNATFRIEVFASVYAGPLGYGEGQINIGVANVMTDANGNASFSVSLVSGFPGYRVFSATATDASGNTSEFSPAFSPPGLLNLSTRTAVGAGENVSIGGFIVAGTEDKKVLLRGLGPSLTQAGVNGVLADPTLELRDATGGLIAFNNNWKDSHETEISQTGLAPANEAEAAMLATLPAKPVSQGGAAYTAILAGNNGKTGIGLFEIYDLAAGANSKLANISTRGFVGAGEDVLIGGLIPGPASASGWIRVLIRGIGPSLAAHGVNAPLQNPFLELHNANGATILSNDNWSEASNASEISATGIAPTDSRESAILTSLFPSAYTAIVRGANGATGVALVEVYALN